MMQSALADVLVPHFSGIGQEPALAPDLPGTPHDLSSADFRPVLGAIPKGISVLGVCMEHAVWGATVDSFSSVSLDPPLVTVSLRNGSTALTTLLNTHRFGVSVLRENQTGVAGTFAGPRTPQTEGDSPFTGEQGAPILPDALAWFTCRLQDTHVVSDHTLVVGRAIQAQKTHGRPLIRYESSYHSLT